VTRPTIRARTASTVVIAITMTKPRTSVRRARLPRRGRRRTRDRACAATAPNPGPRTIAPVIRICESSTMPIAVMSVAIVMKDTYVKESSESA
jgi:hypothetical protein